MQIHASAVSKDGRAVIFTGDSGSGKSDLALRMLDRGWTLVGDDYLNLTYSNGQILASPVAALAGKLELRGLGIIEKLAYQTEQPVTLHLNLVPHDQVIRLPAPRFSHFYGVSVRKFEICSWQSSAPLLVERALAIVLGQTHLL